MSHPAIDRWKVAFASIDDSVHATPRYRQLTPNCGLSVTQPQPGLIQQESHPGNARGFTTDETIAGERDNIRLTRASQDQYRAPVSSRIRNQVEQDYTHLNSGQHRAVQERGTTALV